MKISDIEFQMQSPDFWKDHEKAGRLSKELNNLKEETVFWGNFNKKLDDFLQLSDFELSSRSSEILQFKKKFDKRYIGAFLSGKYNRGHALLYVYSGAGGVDAQDWASMLLRMYQKYAENNGWSFTILDQSLGEQNGTKNAVAEIGGQFAYGYLKGESGVHRLVRISPFSAKGLRHTSFVLVDILPELEDVKIEIDSKDLRVDTFRSSGPGGQNVNKLETAVRITHIPTNIAVAVQSERSQAQNKEKAMQILKSRLAKLMEDKKVAELTQLRAESREIEWGSQIRSYVLNPYKQVKDHRTGIESSQPDKVLEGELEDFIEAEIQAIQDVKP
ncbi:MAG: peptide chain release factor 2 [Candidatus Yanofskybacteria bacterium]|nr:peptide chain release factor 2 [Candidatus Yanofskybacteria bacterium]